MKDFPLVLLGKVFWTPLIDYLRQSLLGAGTIDATDVQRWLVTDSPDEAVQVIRERAMRQFGLTYGRAPSRDGGSARDKAPLSEGRLKRARTAAPHSRSAGSPA
ncbi:MAG: hypothetical protein WDO74_14960 [Pseudomonadota bacterium]